MSKLQLQVYTYQVMRRYGGLLESKMIVSLVGSEHHMEDP